MHDLAEAAELLTVGSGEADFRLNAFLPASVEKETLLGSKAEIVLVPLAIRLENAQIGKQFADILRVLAGHRHIMSRPRICGDLVLAPARIASGLAVHFQQHEVREAPLLQAPCGA